MQFAILVLETPHDFESRNHPDRAPAYWAAYSAYVAALNEAGIMVGGNALQPPATGATVRHRDGKRVVHDGPFADTKEMLAGLFVIEVPGMKEALEWAARCPSVNGGAAEVRPILPMGPR